MLTYHKTTEEEKEAITAWQYTGEYAIYNTAPYAEQKARVRIMIRQKLVRELPTILMVLP